jgi:hypothetical protein
MLALLPPQPAVGQTAPLLTLPGGTSQGYVDQGDGKPVTLVYPAVVEVDPDSLSIVLVSVSRDDAADDATANQFGAAFKHDGAVGPRVEVTVTPSGAIRQGVYALQLRVLFHQPAGEETPAATERAELMTVKVVHPAATLSAVTPVVVEQVVVFPWDAPKTKVKVHLAERSYKSGLGPIGVAPEETVKHDGVSQAVTVSSAAMLTPLGPGDHRDVELTIDGRPPLGTSVARLEVDAAQLDTPSTFTVEIRRRMNLFWIGLFAALGVLFGLLTRVWLADRVEKKQAELSARRVLIEIDIYWRRAADATYRKDLADAAAGLQSALDGYDKAADVVANVATANTALQTARTRLGERRAIQDVRRKTLEDQLAPKRDLPRVVGNEVQDLLRKLEAVERLLADDNVSGALASIDSIEADVDGVLGARLRTWVAEQRNVAQGLSTGLGSSALPKAVAADVTAAFATLTASLAKIPDGPTPVAGLGARLEAVANVLTALAQVTKALGGVSRSLDGLAVLEPVAWAKVRAASQTFDETLARFGDAEDQSATWADVQKSLSSLLTTAREAILDEVAGEPTGTQSLLDAGDYGAAALQALASRTPADVADAPVGESMMHMTTLKRTELAWAGYGGIAVGHDGSQALPPSGPIAQLSAAQAKTVRELLTARLLQTLLLGLAAVPIAYLLFATGWIGSISNIAAVFLWGFAADISVNGMLTAARAAQPATPPAPHGGTPTPSPAVPASPPAPVPTTTTG